MLSYFCMSYISLLHSENSRDRKIYQRDFTGYSYSDTYLTIFIGFVLVFSKPVIDSLTIV